MTSKRLHRNLLLIFVTDALLVLFSIYLAYLLRFDFRIPDFFARNLVLSLPLILCAKMVCFTVFDLYRGMWRFTSIPDLWNIVRASTLSSLLIVAGILVTSRFHGFPRSAFAIDWVLTILLLTTLRLFVRLYFEMVMREGASVGPREMIRAMMARRSKRRSELLIVGAGNCGETICRELRTSASGKYHVLGFLDDDPGKYKRKIHGVPVLGPIDGIRDIARQTNANEVLIAIPSATAAEMRRIVERCKSTGLPFKTIPGYSELIDGRVSVRAIREVAYRDLLGRAAVTLDQHLIGDYIGGNVILVTGAAGSIGAELCRQICRFSPLELILFERAESALYDLELELRKAFPYIRIVPVLGDVLDRSQLHNTFSGHRPKAVFHAAAYKHVPMLELQPWRAIVNNIIGTKNVADVASDSGTERFVFVSTDKAVRPVNVMGATKRVSEMLLQCRGEDSEAAIRYTMVRFGNVLGSAGSVVPLFKRQIEQGGPVTVTHPDVTRYFMTIPEACQLILQAGAMGSGNEIFLLDMGTAIKIDDMAHDLIRLYGLEPGVDIPIQYTGLRPGEKLYEELITEGEDIVPTRHEKILMLKNGAPAFGRERLELQIARLRALAEAQNREAIRSMLMAMVPEYRPADPLQPDILEKAAAGRRKVVSLPQASVSR